MKKAVRKAAVKKAVRKGRGEEGRWNGWPKKAVKGCRGPPLTVATEKLEKAAGKKAAKTVAAEKAVRKAAVGKKAATAPPRRPRPRKDRR